jgi:hypothetical protein
LTKFKTIAEIKLKRKENGRKRENVRLMKGKRERKGE